MLLVRGASRTTTFTTANAALALSNPLNTTPLAQKKAAHVWYMEPLSTKLSSSRPKDTKGMFLELKKNIRIKITSYFSFIV